MGETYDAPSTPGSDATTPAPKYQQSLSELKTKGIAVDDNGFPTYDPTLFGSDVHSDRQRSDMLAVSSSTDNSEMQKMLEAQAGMFDADGNLLPDAQDRLKADERREREQNLARREASMYESFGKSSSSNATRTAGSRHTGQITGLDHQLQSGTQTAVSKGLAQSHRQPPGFTPDRPAPAAIPSVSASINGFSQDATSQQNGFAHPHSQQQTQAPPQNPLTQFAADLNANGLDHSHRQPGAPAQRPQPTPLAKGNAFAHPQQPALQSYGSAGFSDTAMSSFSQPSASGDFSSELWAADARKHSQDWAWVQQQEQRKSAQRSAAQQPAAQQSFSQQGTAQQGFPQHQPGYRQQGSPQQQFHQQAAAPQPSLPHEHPFMQTSAAPVYSANATEPVPTHGFDPAEAMAKKVHVTDQEQDMDVNDLEDFILSSLNHD